MHGQHEERLVQEKVKNVTAFSKINCFIFLSSAFLQYVSKTRTLFIRRSFETELAIMPRKSLLYKKLVKAKLNSSEVEMKMLLVQYVAFPALVWSFSYSGSQHNYIRYFSKID
jgi:hypothetical protein